MQAPVCEGTVISIVESMKKKNLYGAKINKSLLNISAGEDLFNVLKYITFKRKRFRNAWFVENKACQIMWNKLKTIKCYQNYP